MPSYRAPVDDFLYLLFDLHQIEAYKDLPNYEQLDRSLVKDVLEGAGTFCAEVLQPLNQIGDEEGCTFENGVVRTPRGFAQAYKAYCEAGWNRLGAPEAYGGAQLPMIVGMAVSEMGFSSNQAFTMYPGLTTAAYSALIGIGAPWMREHIAPRMVSGEWCGTMCLTEAHCGTDLKLMKTRAVEQPDGTYKLSGTKIFISGGEHDMASNIVHMVIAKIPDADGKLHDDLSTVNFFMVPKFVVGEDGKVGQRNGVFCGSIEKKMGIKGSATCVMNFDDAVAWRLGPKPQPKTEGADGKKSSSSGMKGMFAMMNGARLGVGIQGIAMAEVAYQNAANYSRERLTGRSLTGAKNPSGPADPIIVHPDVRRMLLSARAFAEGARALSTWTCLLMGVQWSQRPAEERQEASELADLLTPVIKAFFTDMGFDATNASMQCFGGHGYVRDHGMEQFVRDARINQVYEGANGVQGLDLVGRKLAKNGGRAAFSLFKKIQATIDAESGAEMTAYVRSLKAGLERLQKATLWLAQNGLKNPDNAGAASADFLRMFGIVATGWMWVRMAAQAQDKLEAKAGDPAFWNGKLACARYWMERVMPDTASLGEKIEAGSDGLMMLEAANF
jgi:alkylation response protein AidB-like acyl-CoA dehydrogenase